MTDHYSEELPIIERQTDIKKLRQHPEVLSYILNEKTYRELSLTMQ